MCGNHVCAHVYTHVHTHVYAQTILDEPEHEHGGRKTIFHHTPESGSKSGIACTACVWICIATHTCFWAGMCGDMCTDMYGAMYTERVQTCASTPARVGVLVRGPPNWSRACACVRARVACALVTRCAVPCPRPSAQILPRKSWDRARTEFDFHEGALWVGAAMWVELASHVLARSSVP